MDQIAFPFTQKCTRCTNYLAQPAKDNGRPVDLAYDINIASSEQTPLPREKNGRAPSTQQKLTELCGKIPPSYFPPQEHSFTNPISGFKDYVRTMISFGIISLFVMAMGCGFSVYTFHNPRYMFKRLAAGIHFISTSCTFVVVQVMMSSVDHMKKSVKFIYPERAYHYYNISFFLAWFVVLVNLFAAASFLWYSRKRKGDKAATDELAMADEPTIIGR
ncbi:hypothetical protein HF086_001755 [Spodoptera exigua]|uniref:Uncharacterized protein n=1 Tax=Spodoptera exigua TaxID=7107 RepID=A0A922S851_SPOEX|nr:hypothetical protein HF086_001755 [Spodoptera exigua]